jgi:hypothetical protein
MKVKLEIDLTPKEAKELFVPSDKQTEFGMLLYDAYVDALKETTWKHIDPHNVMRFQKDK